MEVGIITPRSLEGSLHGIGRRSGRRAAFSPSTIVVDPGVAEQLQIWIN
jgi:hypothetical protein